MVVILPYMENPSKKFTYTEIKNDMITQQKAAAADAGTWLLKVVLRFGKKRKINKNRTNKAKKKTTCLKLINSLRKWFTIGNADKSLRRSTFPSIRNTILKIMLKMILPTIKMILILSLLIMVQKM